MPGIGTAVRLALGTAAALGLARFAFGLLVPAMRHELGWTLADAGALSTANGMGYLIGAAAAGPASRWLGTGRTFRLGMVATAVALAASALPQVLTQVAARSAAGVGGALVFVAGGVIASRMATRAGSPMPITVYFAGAGLAIAPVGAVLPFALDGHPERWAAAWLVLAAAAVGCTVLSWPVAVGDPIPAATTGRPELRPLWPVAVAYVLFGAGYISYITFLSAHLSDQRATAATIAATWAAIGIGILAGPAVWHRPLTRWGTAITFPMILLVLAASAALSLTGAAAPLVLASGIGYGLAFMSVPAALTALVRDVIEPDRWPATIGTLTTLFAAGQAAGPWLAGWLADGTAPAATLAFTAVLCAAGATIALTRVVVRPRRSRNAADRPTGSAATRAGPKLTGTNPR